MIVGAMRPKALYIRAVMGFGVFGVGSPGLLSRRPDAARLSRRSRSNSPALAQRLFLNVQAAKRLLPRQEPRPTGPGSLSLRFFAIAPEFSGFGADNSGWRATRSAARRPGPLRAVVQSGVHLDRQRIDAQ